MMFRKPIVKIGIAVLSVSLLLLSAITTAIASDVHLIEKGLVARGYPLQLLNTISIGAKEELYQSGSTFDRATIQTYDLETGETEKQEMVAGQVFAMPLNQIDENHLALIFLIGTDPKGNKNISFHYEWKRLPLNRWQDPVGVSWNNDYFYIKTDSFVKVDYYTFKSSYDSELRFAINSEQHSFAEGGPNGVTWDAKLRGHSLGAPVYSLWGYAFFTLVPRTSHGKSELYGRYVHAKVSHSLSLSIPNFGGFTVSGGSGYDKLGTKTDINW